MKNVLTFTAIAGTRACPNNCPICISMMTPFHGVHKEKIPINIECLRKSIRFALNHNAQSLLITGKGEPSLAPGQITQYLIEAKDHPFDKRELQVSGSVLAKDGMINDFLDVWRALGLDFIAVSIYHYDDNKSQQLFDANSGHYFNLSNLIQKLRKKGFRVRLSCVMANGYIDSVDEVKKLIQFAKEHKVMQLSLRDIDVPKNSLNEAIANNAKRLMVSGKEQQEILAFIREGVFCDRLPHGAEIYEIDNQNVCITTGLTNDAGKEDIRQLIFFPQGVLTSSWETVQGSRIL